MGVILDSSVLITSERQGRNARQMLTAIARTAGNTDIAVSVVTLIELAFGSRPAKTKASPSTRPPNSSGPKKRRKTSIPSPSSLPKLHRADGRPRPVVRMPAVFPHGLYAERGQGTATRVFRSQATCSRKAILAVEPPRPGQPVLIDFENPRNRGHNLWMSTRYQRPCVTIHFTWKQDWPAVSELLPIIERELAPFQARPPWGKLVSAAHDERKNIYAKRPNSSSSLRNYVPQGEFRNEFLNKNIFASSRRAVRQAFWGLKPPSHSPPSPL
jgi:hypothetical protein